MAMPELELIGRDKELKALLERLRVFLEHGEKRQALWLHVVGEHGIGKTRLLDELLYSARSIWSLQVLQAYDFGVGQFPFGAVSSALCADLGISFGESEYSKKEKLESRLAALSSLKLPPEVFQSETILPVFGQLLGISYPVEFATGIPRVGKGKLLVFNAFRRYLQALRLSGGSMDAPQLIVLWFDDLERADCLSLELLVHLVQKKENLWPLLLLSSSCNSFSGRLDYLSEFQEFSLGPLSKLSKKKVVQHLQAKGPSGSLPPQIEKALIDGAPGNPQLLLETFRLLAEKGPNRSVWERKKGLVSVLESKSRALDVIDLPSILRERFRRLDQRKRAILQSVAALGAYCSFELLSRLLSRVGNPPRNLEELLRSLAAEGFLHAGTDADTEGTIRLSYPLAYDILLDSIPGDKLTSLMQHSAELFYEVMDEEGLDFVFAASEYLRGAYLLKEEWAVDVLSACGDRLFALEDYGGAVRVYGEAVARFGLQCAEEGWELPAGVVEKLNMLLVKMGKARLGAGAIKEAFGSLTVALQLARSHQLVAPRVEACLGVGEIMMLRGDWSGAERFYEEGRQAAQDSVDESLSARCLIAIGNVHLRREDFSRAEELFEQALALSRNEEATDRRLEILLNLGYIRQQSEDFEKADKLYSEALGTALERRDETAAVTALSNLGRIRYEQDRIEEALELFHQALEALRNSGDLQQTGNWLGYIGSVYFSMEEYETAIDYYNQALSLAQITSNLRNQGIWLANLGNAHYEIKEIGKALEFYLRALELAREDQDYSYVSTLLSTIGVYYYNLKQYEMANRYFNESLSLALEIGNLLITVQNILYRGAIMAHLGDEKSAYRALEEGEALAVENGMLEHQAVAELFRAHIALHAYHLEQARTHCQKAAKIASNTANKKLIAEIQRALAACKENPPAEGK